MSRRYGSERYSSDKLRAINLSAPGAVEGSAGWVHAVADGCTCLGCGKISGLVGNHLKTHTHKRIVFLHEMAMKDFVYGGAIYNDKALLKMLTRAGVPYVRDLQVSGGGSSGTSRQARTGGPWVPSWFHDMVEGLVKAETENAAKIRDEGGEEPEPRGWDDCITEVCAGMIDAKAKEREAAYAAAAGA